MTHNQEFGQLGMSSPVLSRRSLLQRAAYVIAAAMLPRPAQMAAQEVSPVMAKLSAYMSEARNRALPENVVREAVHHILDTFAAMVSGSELPPGRRVIEFARAYGGEKIATVVTSKMFGWLFDGQNGIVNYLLRSVGLIQHNIDWYGSPDFALATIVIADVWKTTPFMALLLLAGLQTIPESLAEASIIDGANAWQHFWHVRLPLLTPTLLIASMFRALDAFRIFDLVYVLTGGGPADSTEVLSTLTYKQLFSALQLGYGSALATIMFITEILIAVVFGVFLLRKMREVGQ